MSFDVTSPGGAAVIGGGAVTAGGIGATIHGATTAGKLGQRQETVRVLEQADAFAHEFGELQAAAGRAAPGQEERLARIASQLTDARGAVSYAEHRAPLIRNLGIGAAVLGAAAIATGFFVFSD
jgi:hypothetical protein